ncbi:hypothetical protein COO60DRAFT_1004676 [Scenedesmus sp. NREL 46B-D3]|nr:hypothetical protein COO60DRAFT_1004676 [Scenedesmus sp. NREL 46B-D3]
MRSSEMLRDCRPMAQHGSPWVCSVRGVCASPAFAWCAPARCSRPCSLEDLVGLGVVRAAAISATYAYGSKRYQLRPYLYTSYVVGGLGFVYALVKASRFAYPLAWLPPAGMLATFGVFSWLHILAARHTVTWARRQGMLGLAPFNPWAGGIRRNASAGSLPNAASPVSSSSTRASWLADSADADVAPELLADPDSRFVTVQGITVHYKEAWPEKGCAAAAAVAADGSNADGSSAAHPEGSAGSSKQAAAWILPESPTAAEEAETVAAAAKTLQGAVLSAAGEDVAVVLVHGFGGGTFAWRHVLQPLATAAGVRVVAFDRPGFGSAGQPSGVGSSSVEQQRQPLLQHHHRSREQQQQQQQAHRHNPYSVEAHAHLALRFCAVLGIKRVVLVGHADGCLVVVHAAAAACRAARHMQQQQQQQQRQRSLER